MWRKIKPVIGGFLLFPILSGYIYYASLWWRITLHLLNDIKTQLSISYLSTNLSVLIFAFWGVLTLVLVRGTIAFFCATLPTKKITGRILWRK